MACEQEGTMGMLTKSVEEKNLELKTENKMLGDQMHTERDDREKVLDLLQDAIKSAQKPQRHLGRFLGLLTVAGISYAFGTKAGRERYHQIRAGLQRFTNGGLMAPDEQRRN